MSEYQYYEFRAIDRPLDEEEQSELRRLSTRAEITATSLTNTYHYGDFRGDPAKLMDRYFDAFVYVANWGTRQLMFRIPKRFLDAETASDYCDGESLSLKSGEQHIILDFSSDDEGGGEWTEGEPWMPSLISIREELMRGDLRALYLGWLAAAPMLAWEDEQEPPEDGERLEPPVPPGLAKLSSSLKSLAEFLRIDDELIRVAAMGSAGDPPAEPTSDELVRWVKGLSVAEKDAYLLRVLAPEGDSHLRLELQRRFREASTPRRSRANPVHERRSLKQLIEARDALAAETARKNAERAARERAAREHEQVEARAKHLDDLARREPSAWRDVESLIATRISANYERAVEILVDLRELAERSGRSEEARTRTEDIRLRHARKSSLMTLFSRNKLG